jgi:hypothetical protein
LVAICVVQSVVSAVGARGTPASSGESSGAFAANSVVTSAAVANPRADTEFLACAVVAI